MAKVVARVEKLRADARLLKDQKGEASKEVTRCKNALKRKTLTDPQRAEAERMLAGAEEALATLASQHARTEAELKLEEAYDYLKRAQEARKDAGEAAFLAAVPETGDAAFSALVRELINLRATANRLRDRNDELTDFVRTWVLGHATGWVPSDNPERWYLVWVSPDGTLQVILQDQPAYVLTVDALVELIGFQAATQFLAVEFGSVEQAAKDGLLRDQKGNPVTVEQLRDLRERHERAKQVKPLERGPEHVGDVIAVIAPELLPQFTADVDSLGLELQTASALRAAGIERIGQLRMSGDDLTRIKDIGPARAKEILGKLARSTV